MRVSFTEQRVFNVLGSILLVGSLFFSFTAPIIIFGLTAPDCWIAKPVLEAFGDHNLF